MVASPEDDYQEHLNHRGEEESTRNQITTAQYECFQRIVKESHRKTKTIGEQRTSETPEFFIFLFPIIFIATRCCVYISRATVQHDVGWVAVLG